MSARLSWKNVRELHHDDDDDDDDDVSHITKHTTTTI
jgi:hypothetical protein